MSTVITPLSGVNKPLKGIAFIVMATFLFSSHDTLSKYLSGIYPIIMVVWVRYVVHTLLMACIFMPSAGLRVLRTKRPGLQALRAACLLGTSLLFTSGLMYSPGRGHGGKLPCAVAGDCIVSAVAQGACHPRPMDCGAGGFQRGIDHRPSGGRTVHARRAAAAGLGDVLCLLSTADPAGGNP